MFKNGFRIKSTAPLKGAEQKKLKATICKRFNLSTGAVDEFLNHKQLTQLKVITHTNDIVKISCAQDTAIVFEFKNKIYPTLYLIWTFPNIVPRLILDNDGRFLLKTTSGLRIKDVKFINGDNDILGSLPVDQCVSLCSILNQKVVAIGYLTIAGTAIIDNENIRDECLKVLHYIGDELFKSYITPTIPNAIFAMKPDLDSDAQMYSEDTQTVVEKMDELLMMCSLKALKCSIKKDMLPILASTFYKKYVMSFCPEGTKLDIKKTSFKKLSTFLQLLDDEQIIKYKTDCKGIVKVTQVNRSNNRFLDVNNDDSAELKETSNTFSLPIKEIYIVTPALHPIFSEFFCRIGDELSVQSIQKYIFQYIKKHQLRDLSDPSIVNVNTVLRKILYQKKKRFSISIKKLIEYIIRLMYRTEIAVINNDKAEFIRSVKKKIIHIKMTVNNRNLDKKVTLVNNLELYGMDLNKFSKECQHGVAASTTINDIPNSLNRQVQIQGSQVNFVFKLLIEKYKIPINFLKGYQNYITKRYLFTFTPN